MDRHCQVNTLYSMQNILNTKYYARSNGPLGPLLVDSQLTPQPPPCMLEFANSVYHHLSRPSLFFAVAFCYAFSFLDVCSAIMYIY